MAEIFTRRRTLPPYKDGSGLSQRDQALARVEVLLREELLPPADEENGPAVAPEPVNPAEVVEVSRLPLPARPPGKPAAPRPKAPAPAAAPTPPPSKTSPLHTLLQILILLFVLSWVFILGIVVGRGHLWESGPVYSLVLWLEQQANWNQAEEFPVVHVREPSAASEEEADWEDVRRQYGYSGEAAPGAGEEDDSWPAIVPYQGPDDPSGPTGGEAAGAEDSLTNSQWLSAAPSLLNYDGPAVGYQERDGLPAAEEFDEDDSEEATAPTAGENQPAPAVEALASALRPQPVPPAEPAAAQALPGSADGKYAVQVASPHEEAEAQRRVEKLHSQGLPAYYYQTPGGRYPVRVGRFATQAEAAEAKARLDSLGYKGHYISTLTD